jgi:hypothetical protein
MGILSSKPASESDVLRAVELKAIALGSKLDTGHDLLIPAAAAIKAGERARVHPREPSANRGELPPVEDAAAVWQRCAAGALSESRQPGGHCGDCLPAQQAGQRCVCADALAGARRRTCHKKRRVAWWGRPSRLDMQVYAELEALLSPTLARLHHGPPQLGFEIGFLGLPVHALVCGHVVAAHCRRLAIALECGLLFRSLPLRAAGEPAWRRLWGCSRG